jgi:hypothetical protein
MPSFAYPTSSLIQAIDQDMLPVMEAGRVGLELFPTETQDEDQVRWEQQDNFMGLQAVRGLNGEPSRVAKTGAKGYAMQPGYYGEFELIDEAELTRRRQFGTFGTPIDISDLVGIAEQKLLQRELDRKEWIVWTLLQSGIFSVQSEDGVLHQDAFPILTFTASPAWSTTATATPVADLRSIRLMQRGHSVAFGRAATLYVNQKKVNQLLSNSNQADLGSYKKPADGLQRLVQLEDINRILLDQDLPQIVEYDRGYYTDAGVWNPWIADNKGVLIGPRLNGAAIGAYKMTRNVNNPDLAPGSYSRVIDRGDNDIPRTIEVHKGHNGGPAIYYPGCVVTLNI